MSEPKNAPPMTRAARQILKRQTKASLRIRARVPGVTVVPVLLHSGHFSTSSAIKVVDAVRSIQQQQGGKRGPIVLLIDSTASIGRQLGQEDRLLSSFVGFVFYTLVEWCYEIQFPTGIPARPYAAFRNPDWRREGLAPEIDFSLRDRDFYVADATLLPQNPSGEFEVLDALKKRFPRMRSAPHAYENELRREGRIRS